MKLASHLIRQAFAADDWAGIISALELGFCKNIPADYTKLTIKQHDEFYDEVLLTSSDGDLYEWNDLTGFVFTPMYEGGLPGNIVEPRITIYKASQQ